MKKIFVILSMSLGLALTSPAAAQLTKMGADLTEEDRQMLKQLLPGFPEPKDGQLIHIPPTMEDLDAADMNENLKEVIRYGYDLFVDTQQLRGKNVFNDMNCSSCHVGAGSRPFAGPVWPALVTLPDYRGKNGHVNNFEERIAGCFTYSMNGKPPAYGSDEMVALTAYHQWLAKGVPVYPDAPIYGRGYPRPEPLPEGREPDRIRGKELYAQNCAVCHGQDGQGQFTGEKAVFPPVWGDGSYNWGAGISRVFTLAGFIKYNMPLGAAPLINDEDAWDIAAYVDSQERPQDPRYTGDVAETLALYADTFHQHTYYGKEVDGKVLADHDNVGYKDFLKPDVLKPRYFGKKPDTTLDE